MNLSWKYFSMNCKVCKTGCTEGDPDSFRPPSLIKRLLSLPHREAEWSQDVSSLTGQAGQRQHRLLGLLIRVQNASISSNLSCVICFAAAQAADICYITSTYASCTLEDIVATAPRGLRWFQLYVQRDRQLNKQLIQRVESLGFKALVITVDVPITGNRRHDIRNQVDLKTNLLLKDLRSPKEVGKIPEPMGEQSRRHLSIPLSSLLSFHKNSLSVCSVQDTGNAAVQKVDLVPGTQNFQTSRI